MIPETNNAAPLVSSSASTLEIGSLKMSRPFGRITAALQMAQARMGPALKAVENPIHGSHYADLSSVLAACREPLQTEGILLMQPAAVDGARVTVTTVLMKEEEWIASDYTILAGSANAWDVGSATTYAKRYGLKSLLAMATEDDDGNASMRATQQGGKASQQPSHQQGNGSSHAVKRQAEPRANQPRVESHAQHGSTSKEWVEAISAKNVPFLRLPVTMNNDEGRLYAFNVVQLILDGREAEVSSEFDAATGHKRQFIATAFMHFASESHKPKLIDFSRDLQGMLPEGSVQSAHGSDAIEQQWMDLRRLNEQPKMPIPFDQLNSYELQLMEQVRDSHVGQNYQEIHRSFLEGTDSTRELIRLAIANKKADPNAFAWMSENPI